MSRGFGATLGAGTTDKITTTLTTHATQRSYSLWFWLNGTGGGGLGRLFDKCVATNSEFLLHNETAIAYERVWSGAEAAWTIAAPATGAWHHLLLTYDAGNTANDPVIYLDGVSQTVTEGYAPSGTLVTSTDAYTLGSRGLDSNRYFDGSLAEFAVWDSLLTSGNAISLAGGALPNSIGSPTCYFQILGDDSPEPDISMNRYSGTVTGTAKRNHPPLLQGYLKYRKP